MIPAFPIEGGFGLAAGRAASVAGLMAAFGGLFYLAALAPPGASAPTERRLQWVAWSGIGAAVAGSLLWLALETADLADTITLENVGDVLRHTWFGRLLLWRLGLLGLAGGALALRYRIVAAGLAGLALVAQAGHSHAEAMMGPGWLLLSSGLHVFAAGAWLGSLLPLWVVCAGEPAAIALVAAKRFSPVGLACVGTLAVTSTTQYVAWIANLHGLLATAYGWMACLKLVSFAVLLGLAAGNRFRHNGAAASFEAYGHRELIRNIVIEIVLGLLVILAAGVLSELPPSIHAQMGAALG